jgi:hypothetical protein
MKKANMKKLFIQYIKAILVPILYIVISLDANSQPNTLYFMDMVHQSDNINPANQNCCNGFYSLPVISGFGINLLNSGFDYNDLIHFGSGNLADSLIIDIDNVKSKLGKKNYVLNEINIPIFGFGFHSGRSFLSFEISNKTKTFIAYPENLIALTSGNAKFIGANNPATINKFGPNLLNYYEFAFGWSREITKKLTLGAKLKVLSGTVALQQKKSDFKLTTADTTYAMSLQTDLNYNISAPVEFSYDENGMINDANYNSSNIVKDITPGKNYGLAIDFGAIYQLTEKIKLYGSITDLGFIRWGTNSTNIFQKGTFEYKGLSLDSVWTQSDYNELQAWGDSLTNFFKFEHADTKFTTSLNSNIFIGGSYEITPFLSLALLSRTSLYNKSLHQAFTFSANFKPLKTLSASLSYSAMNREYKNVGLGLSYRLGPIQLYVVTDNIYTAFMPKNSKIVNVMMGFNMVFGCNKRDNYSMLNNSAPSKKEDFY